MNEFIAQHDINDWPSIRLIRTVNDEYKVQVNEASGYDHIDWVTVRLERDFKVALHNYSERLVFLLYKEQLVTPAPCVTSLYQNMFG